MRSNCCLKNKGLSLLELVVAVATLTLGITIVLQAFSASSRTTAISQDMLKAVSLAEDKLQEIEFKRIKDDIEEEKLNGKTDKFEWEYTLKKPDPGTGISLYQLDINISWRRASKTDNLDLTTYLR